MRDNRVKRYWVIGIRCVGASAEGAEDAGPKLCQECAISERANSTLCGVKGESIGSPRKHKEGLFILRCCQNDKFFSFLIKII